MAKLKQTFSGTLKYKAEPEYMISQYEINLLNANPFESLLKVQSSKNGELTFSVPVSHTLCRELENGINKTELPQFIQQILQLLDVLKKMGLSKKRVILSPEYIYVEEKTGILKFVYLPVNGEMMAYDEILLIKDLILKTKLSGNDRILWDKWSRGLLPDTDVKKALLKMPANRTAKAGYGQGGLTEQIGDEAETGVDEDQSLCAFEDWSADPSAEAEEEALTGLDEDAQNQTLWQNDAWDDGDEALTGLAEDLNFDAMDKNDGTFQESLSDGQSNSLMARLVSLQSGESVVVRGSNFVIGRSQNETDYRIDDSHVSGKHATILKRNGQYYIKDNHSTNGTYLDGEKLAPFEEVGLMPNSIVKFYKLEYRFELV